MKINEAIRHGEILLVRTKEMPKIKDKSQVIIRGSHGNEHSIVNGVFYPMTEGENVIGYLKANKGAFLTHKDHGEVVGGSDLRRVDLDEGVYRVVCQVEDKNSGMEQVID